MDITFLSPCLCSSPIKSCQWPSWGYVWKCSPSVESRIQTQRKRSDKFLFFFFLNFANVSCVSTTVKGKNSNEYIFLTFFISYKFLFGSFYYLSLLGPNRKRSSCRVERACAPQVSPLSTVSHREALRLPNPACQKDWWAKLCYGWANILLLPAWVPLVGSCSSWRCPSPVSKCAVGRW